MSLRTARHASAVLVAGLVFGMGTNPAPGQCERTRLLADDGADNDDFGVSVAISGDYLIVGAPDDDAGQYGPYDAGAAYVFKRTEADWTQVAKLTADDDRADGDKFGASVSISGDYAIAGVEFDDDAGMTSGSAYVFRRSGESWVEDVKLTAGADSAGFDHFGVSVAIDGDYAVVGASFDDDNANDSGSAYVFKRSGMTWNFDQKLTAGDPGFLDQFGHSVAVSGDTIVIGAIGANNSAAGYYDSGAAYVFMDTPTGWQQKEKLTAGTAAGSYALFGNSVSVDADVLVVGADRDDNACGDGGDRDCGAAYVFRRRGASWDQEGAPLIPEDTHGGQKFGSSVSVSGESIIVGAPYDGHAGTDSGSAYLFGRRGPDWVELAKVIATDAAEDDRFGASVAIEGAETVLGAPGDDPGTAVGRSGSAYVATDCNGNGIPDKCEVPPIDPEAPDCNENGVPDDCEPDCQPNDIPDACEIADGTSDDCQDDGIPDECQFVTERRVVIDEGFEGDPPAPGWLTIAYAPNGPWGILAEPDYVYSGTQSAGHPRSVADYADSYLLTPELNLVTGSLSVWTLGCFGEVWCDWYDIDVMIIVGLPGGDDDIFVGNLNELYVNYYTTWENASYDLTPLLPGGNFRIGFRYYGLDGDLGVIDDVLIEGQTDNDCNTNEIPDDCDIAQGPSTDANGNGVPDECECPEGVVVFSDPPDGVIDARQPYPPDDAGTPQGIDAIVVSGPAGATNLGCWTTCETASVGSPIEITWVLDHGDGTFTLGLNRPITPGEVTTVSYTTSTGIVQSASFTSHPGNVNGDATAGLPDIAEMVACCLNHVCDSELTRYRCDVDRSSGPGDGDLSEGVTAADILRVIDILNGAGEFDPWLDTPRPSCGDCCP